MSQVNLNDLANRLARKEGLKRSAGGSPQIKEILGILGRELRSMPLWKAMAIMLAIRKRAGTE